MDRVMDAYEEVYETERQTSAVEEGLIPGMYNRVRTNGKYGIWGHELGDLLLVGMKYDPKKNIVDLTVDT